MAEDGENDRNTGDAGDAGERSAVRELYSVAPEDFLARRTALVAGLKSAGASAGAKRVGALRKPTVSAWLVNALVHDDPSVVDRLRELGGRLRAAQQDLDASALRELSRERRSLTTALTQQAFATAGRADPPAGLRDDVSGTLDAAIADPEVAEQLGRLVRPQRWSGFGFAPNGPPQLRVIHNRPEPDAPASTARTPTSAQRRRRERDVRTARQTLEQAEQEVADAEAALRRLLDAVEQGERRLAEMRDQLNADKESVSGARSDILARKKDRQQARRALDRVERN